MKSKSQHFLMKTMALALALILTLGSLPLLSFAEDIGRPEAPEPAGPQGDGNDYAYSFPIEFFFATGNVVGNHYSYKGFWPSWHNTIKGTIYSNTLEFKPENITKSHYIVGTQDIEIFNGAVLKLNYDNGSTTDYFPIEDISKPEIFNPLLSEIRRVSLKETFIMRDHNNNPVILKPEDLEKDGFSIRVFRYANPLNVTQKLHVDIYVERPDGQQPIHVKKMNLPGGIQEFTSQGKYGMSPIEEDGYVVSKVEVTEVGGNTEIYETQDDIKNNPVIHNDKEKTVRVWYSKNIKFHVVKDGADPEKVGEYLAELGKDYDVTDVLTTANLPDEYEYKGMRLKEQSADLLDKDKTIPSAEITKDLNDVYLYFETIDNKSNIHVTIEKEGEATTNENVELIIGDTYNIPAIPNGYVLESFIVDGTQQPAGVVSFQVTKPYHNVVVKFAKKTSGDILVVPSTLDDVVFTLEELNKYGLQQISLASQPGVPVEIEIAEPKGLKIKSVMNNTVEIQPNGEGKYVVTNNSPDQLVLRVHYKKHISSLNVIEVVDGAEAAPKTVEGQVGEEFKPSPKEGYDIELFVKTPGTNDYQKVEHIFFEEQPQDVKVVYTKKPSNGGNNNGGNDNGGNNNNNNNDNNTGNNGGGDNNGGNNNAGNDNNNNNNDNGGDQNKDKDKDKDKNKDKDKDSGTVITDDGKTPLGPIDKEPFYAYMQGYPDGSVRPEAYVSRQEAAAIFFRLLDPAYRESIRSEKNTYIDVNKAAWSNKHISTLTKGGIIQGYSDGTFKPLQIITRAELIEIATRFAALNAKSKQGFKEFNGALAPNMMITRAELAKIINKILGRNVDKTEILPGVKKFTDLSIDMASFEDMITATNSYNAKQGNDGYQKWTELIEADIEM